MGPPKTSRVQVPGLGGTRELMSQSALAKEHVALDASLALPVTIQGLWAGPFTPLSLFPHLKRELVLVPAPCHTCTVSYSVPTPPWAGKEVPGASE